MNQALIITDLEGISGVSEIGQVLDTASEGYRHACERLMADTNAAVDGAFAGGAEAVYVWDGHGGGKNFIPGVLDARAVQIDGTTVLAHLRDIDAMILVGMHAMSGTQRAFLDHTQSSASIFDYCYNGVRRGEITQECIFAGHFGIPCVAVTGDRAACEEAIAFRPGVFTAEVKSAEERNIAECIPDAEAEARIFEAAKRGFEARASFEPYVIPLPFTISVTFTRADHCDNACRNRPWVTRIDARTAERVSDKIETYCDILL